ncbi:MAG: MOSC domain-containing protein [Ignavibacteriales bacterium]|nr:MOSC domain-containing protein [Ignavibacteriales bacterium]
MPSLHLTEIHIYPIKSARGISLSSARLDDRGLELDRRWMVVDEDGHFLTQRTLPRMALIHVTLGEDHLSVTSRGLSELIVPFRRPSGAMIRVRVWEDSLDVMDVGQDAASWFTELLGVRCRLVQMPEKSERFIDSKYAPVKSPVSFADAFPLLLMSETSLDDLNTRLAEPVPMNRFRPNLVIAGSSAYEEDTWRILQIGSVSFRVAKPCARCSVPTVDQDTGEAGKEPIRTLSTYRTRDSKVYFGQNLIHEGRGIVNVGDAAHAMTR